jgi:hypothetical protein
MGGTAMAKKAPKAKIETGDDGLKRLVITEEIVEKTTRKQEWTLPAIKERRKQIVERIDYLKRESKAEIERLEAEDQRLDGYESKFPKEKQPK